MLTKKPLFQHGFTLVELLIVIVVIAILASISVVSYNGITQRAQNTQMITTAKSYHQAILQHSVIHSQYPAVDVGFFGACLGAGYEDDHCWIGPNGNYYVNSQVDAALGEFIGNKPAVPTDFYQVSGSDRRSGIVYYRNNPTGRQSIEYLLSGSDQSCALAGATASNIAGGTATRCQLTLPEL